MDLLKYVLTLPRDLWRLRTLIRRYRVAVVNCHYVGQSEITWAVAKKLGLFRGKLIWSVHGRDGRTLATLGGVQSRMWRWTLRQADAVVAPSRGLALETMRAFHLPDTHVVTIHNGLDASEIAAIATSGQPAPATKMTGPTVLNLGTFEHKKGHDVLLRAFKAVLACYPEAHLTIMGRGAETTESTTRLVAELDLGDHVSLHVDATHEAALRAMRATDLFVLSSRNEAFAIVLLEAGAFAKPVVATDVCGVGELIEDGVTGIVVPPEDPAALAAGMVKALGDPDGAAQLGRRLRDVVSGKFTTTATGRAYLRLAGFAERDSPA
jgi:glycosyltransferase involved in cell wall biosynthesis